MFTCLILFLSLGCHQGCKKCYDEDNNNVGGIAKDNCLDCYDDDESFTGTQGECERGKYLFILNASGLHHVHCHNTTCDGDFKHVKIHKRKTVFLCLVWLRMSLC